MGTCYPDAAAQLLPRALFKCDKKKEGKEEGSEGVPASTLSAAAVTAKPSPLDCVAQNTSAACDEYEACSWCAPLPSLLRCCCHIGGAGSSVPPQSRFVWCSHVCRCLSLRCRHRRPCRCTTSGLGTGCYPSKVAKILPGGFLVARGCVRALATRAHVLTRRLPCAPLCPPTGKFFTCDKFPKPAKEEATCEKR